ncbi:MAG: hypothetical protein F6K55_13700 [Moorea sp. SIO4A3]|nr:hypothetical protein [Moorena sp. SIO4A3]
MICQNSVSLAQFDNGLSPAITESDAARSWEGSAAKGGPPHERLPWFPPLALCIKNGIYQQTLKTIKYNTFRRGC